jgi:hypothetical protein
MTGFLMADFFLSRLQKMRDQGKTVDPEKATATTKNCHSLL